MIRRRTKSFPSQCYAQQQKKFLLRRLYIYCYDTSTLEANRRGFGISVEFVSREFYIPVSRGQAWRSRCNLAQRASMALLLLFAILAGGNRQVHKRKRTELLDVMAEESLSKTTGNGRVKLTEEALEDQRTKLKKGW